MVHAGILACNTFESAWKRDLDRGNPDGLSEQPGRQTRWPLVHTAPKLQHIHMRRSPEVASPWDWLSTGSQFAMAPFGECVVLPVVRHFAKLHGGFRLESPLVL